MCFTLQRTKSAAHAALWLCDIWVDRVCVAYAAADDDI